MPKNTSDDLSLNIGSGNDWVLSGNKSLPEPLLTHIHWSAVITRSDIVRYYMNNYKKCVRMSTRLWIHKRHPIPRPSGWAMGCPLRIFWENGLRYNGTVLYLYMGSLGHNELRLLLWWLSHDFFFSCENRAIPIHIWLTHMTQWRIAVRVLAILKFLPTDCDLHWPKSQPSSYCSLALT